MIVPSIDLQKGHAVQLIGGEEKALDAGDPHPLLKRFSLAGEVAVIDLDAALGQGSNADLIKDLVGSASCRVGGGIRDVESALAWLDAGASQVILGTAARPDVLRQLPKQRVQAALDARDGEVVVEGWRKRTGVSIEQRIKDLDGLVGSYLITFVEREGRLGGVDMDHVARLVNAAGEARVTVAGGVTTLEEVAAIDALGADCQVGMALYTGKMELADAIVAPMTSDRPDGLWPTVITDELGVALGLAWSDLESIRAAVAGGVGAYHSRKRGLWVKGKTSGATQELLGIDLDCDRDALRFRVRQGGSGFCHRDTWTCWGEDEGVGQLARLLEARVQDAPEGSYTRRLLGDPDLLRSKLCEEAAELAEAQGTVEVVWETADVLYFALVALARGGGNWAAVERELARRARKITRRPGDAKPSQGDRP